MARDDRPSESGLRPEDFDALQREFTREDAEREEDRAAGRRRRAALGGILVATGTAMALAGNVVGGNTPDGAGPPAASPPPATAVVAVPGNRPPRVGPIVAVLSPPYTYYAVDADDPDGDPLTYRWTSTNTCDSFTFSGRTAVWRHRHPPCREDEPYHPSTLTVVVSDGRGGEVTRTYLDGSRSGTGPGPATPEKTTPPATLTPAMPSPTPAPSTGGGPNAPLVGGGLALVLAGLGILGWAVRGPRPAAAPPTEETDPCARDRAAEAAARARLDAAESRLERIDRLWSQTRAADAEAEARAHAAEEARAGASFGEVDGRRVYTNKAKAAEIEAADAAAAAARDAATRARSAFDAAGGRGELTAAQDERFKAHRDWTDANGSLQRCLGLFAPPPPPPPSAPPAGGATTGGGGPVVATGGGDTTRERTCRDGEIRRDSERTETREFQFAEIHRAKIVLDAVYPYATEVPLHEFIEWMDFVRRSFKAGKAIKGLAGGEHVGGTLDTIDYSGVVDVPDFLTFWDKMSGAVLDGLRQTGDIFVDRFSKLGGYSLRYTRRTYTATCRTWEECAGGRYVRRSSFSFENTRTDHGASEGPIEVHDKREIKPAIDRLFTALERRNASATRQMEAFAKSCAS